MADDSPGTIASRGPSSSTCSGRPAPRSARASVRRAWARGRSTSTTSSRCPYVSPYPSVSRSRSLPRHGRAVMADEGLRTGQRAPALQLRLPEHGGQHGAADVPANGAGIRASNATAMAPAGEDGAAGAGPTDPAVRAAGSGMGGPCHRRQQPAECVCDSRVCHFLGSRRL